MDQLEKIMTPEAFQKWLSDGPRRSPKLYGSWIGTPLTEAKKEAASTESEWDGKED